MLHPLVRATVALVLTAPLFATDTVGAGWSADGVRALSPQAAFASHDTLSNGDRIVYDGSLVWIEHEDGTHVATLGATAPSFSSFVEVDPTETFAVLGENSNGGIYRVALSGVGGLVPLATLDFNFDLAFEPGAATALVSAATAFPNNQVFRLDLASGATTMIVDVAGPSGPIALSPAGDLYYATQVWTFPTPPDSVHLIRWSAAQIASGPFPLTQAQATTFLANLDGGATMAFDPEFGHLFFAEAADSSPARILEIDRAGTIVGVAATSPDFPGKIERIDVAGAGFLGAFQPAGSLLQYRTTDFVQGTSQIVRIVPRRPELTAVQNGNGTMTVSLVGATPSTSCFVFSCDASALAPAESAYDLGGYALWTAMPYPNVRRAGIQFPADANGNGSFTFANSVPIQGTRAIEVLVRGANGVFRGASTTVVN